MRKAASVLALLWCAAYALLHGGLAARLLPRESWPASLWPSGLWDGLFLVGTALSLPLCALWGLRRPREGGAVLLLASALAAAGLALHAGPYLQRYFPGLLLAVLPQCVVAFLFLRGGRLPGKTVPKRQG